MQDNQYVYHYYFNLYQEKPELIVRKESYIINKHGEYRIKTNQKSDHICLSLNEIGKVYAGRTVVLLERDDLKARQLFTDYLMDRIYKKHSEIERLITLYSITASKDIEFLEGSYNDKEMGRH